MLNFDFVLNRIKNLILTPEKEWKQIQNENQSKKEIIKNFAVPLLIIIVICSILGDIIFTSREHFTIAYIACKAFVTFAIVYSTIYLSALLINELTLSFNSKKDLNVTFKLVVYSFTAYFLSTAFSNLIPPLGLIQVFALYSIYLFWLGCEPLLQTNQDNKIGFVVLSSIIILCIYTFVKLILDHILASIFVLATQVAS